MIRLKKTFCVVTYGKPGQIAFQRTVSLAENKYAKQTTQLSNTSNR